MEHHRANVSYASATATASASMVAVTAASTQLERGNCNSPFCRSLLIINIEYQPFLPPKGKRSVFGSVPPQDLKSLRLAAIVTWLTSHVPASSLSA